MGFQKGFEGLSGLVLPIVLFFRFGHGVHIRPTSPRPPLPQFGHGTRSGAGHGACHRGLGAVGVCHGPNLEPVKNVDFLRLFLFPRHPAPPQPPPPFPVFISLGLNFDMGPLFRWGFTLTSLRWVLLEAEAIYLRVRLIAFRFC